MSYKINEFLGDCLPREVGKKIELARKQEGYSAAEMGSSIGVSHVTILNTEKGIKLSVQTLVALAKQLNNDFGVTRLREHLDKYSHKTPSFYESFEIKIREIVQDELKTISAEKITKTEKDTASLQQFEVTDYGLTDNSHKELKNTERRKKVG
ncbi:MAG TPA: helix-turn-helix transcriptional regulator [Pyrinomonadaceae bacterium]|nr:helix-turn-helix transcriptional regulator [Pyrinomonadaceae bacterium]